MVKGVKIHLFQHFHLIHPAKSMLLFSSGETSFFADALFILQVRRFLFEITLF